MKLTNGQDLRRLVIEMEEWGESVDLEFEL